MSQFERAVLLLLWAILKTQLGMTTSYCPVCRTRMGEHRDGCLVKHAVELTYP